MVSGFYVGQNRSFLAAWKSLCFRLSSRQLLPRADAEKGFQKGSPDRLVVEIRSRVFESLQMEYFLSINAVAGLRFLLLTHSSCQAKQISDEDDRFVMVSLSRAATEA